LSSYSSVREHRLGSAERGECTSMIKRTVRSAAVVFGICVAIGALSGCSGDDDSAGAGGASAGAGGGRTGGSAGRSGSAGQIGSAGAAAAGSGGSSAGVGGNAGGSGGAAGAGGSGAAGGPAAGSGGAPAPGSWWRPKPGTSWQWQLTGKLDTSFDVDAYDIDLFNTSKATIDSLHGQGRKVICYFDTAYEPDRPDSKQLEPYRGNPIDGWPGQYWLDQREPKVLEVMKARLAMAQSKGCDGVEADDVDARDNEPGFPLKAADQQAFIKAIAEDAHARGIAFGLKNALADVSALVSVSDFAVNEECFEYEECAELQPFIAAAKAVFQVEYSEDDLDGKAAEICPDANKLNFDSLIKHLDLDAPRKACR
jgi:hypothetical protein